MLNIANIERRNRERKKLSGLLPGRLYIDGQKSSLSCRPIDVAKGGMGILVSELLVPGTKVLLILKDRELELEIKWGKPDFGKKNLYRYGLECLSEDNLEEIFIQSGCLR